MYLYLGPNLNFTTYNVSFFTASEKFAEKCPFLTSVFFVSCKNFKRSSIFLNVDPSFIESIICCSKFDSALIFKLISWQFN